VEGGGKGERGVKTVNQSKLWPIRGREGSDTEWKRKGKIRLMGGEGRGGNGARL